MSTTSLVNLSHAGLAEAAVIRSSTSGGSQVFKKRRSSRTILISSTNPSLARTIRRKVQANVSPVQGRILALSGLPAASAATKPRFDLAMRRILPRHSDPVMVSVANPAAWSAFFNKPFGIDLREGELRRARDAGLQSLGVQRWAAWAALAEYWNELVSGKGSQPKAGGTYCGDLPEGMPFPSPQTPADKIMKFVDAFGMTEERLKAAIEADKAARPILAKGIPTEEIEIFEKMTEAVRRSPFGMTDEQLKAAIEADKAARPTLAKGSEDEGAALYKASADHRLADNPEYEAAKKRVDAAKAQLERMEEAIANNPMPACLLIGATREMVEAYIRCEVKSFPDRHLDGMLLTAEFKLPQSCWAWATFRYRDVAAEHIEETIAALKAQAFEEFERSYPGTLETSFPESVRIKVASRQDMGTTSERAEAYYIRAAASGPIRGNTAESVILDDTEATEGESGSSQTTEPA